MLCELEPMGPVGDEWRIPESMWQPIEPLLPQERPHPNGGRRYTPPATAWTGRGKRWTGPGPRHPVQAPEYVPGLRVRLSRSSKAGGSLGIHQLYHEPWRRTGREEKHPRLAGASSDRGTNPQLAEPVQASADPLGEKVENYVAMLLFDCAWITFRASGVVG